MVLLLRRSLIGALLMVATALSLPAQEVAYEIAFPNAVHHEAEITVTFTGLSRRAPLQVRMSRTSPGRYALHEFSKNVYNVRVVDGAGRGLVPSRPDPHQWDVEGHNGTVRFSYTLFGDHADGTYTGIDATHAHMNMPATFVWARGLEDAPIRITFHRLDPGWKVATQLIPTGDPDVFTAPDLAYFLDSPTELSAFTMRDWTVPGNGETYTIRLALHHDGTEAEADAFAAMAEKVVAEQIAVFGGPPDYEPGTYTFIADYLPYVDGDGMEHRNSTVLTSTRPLSTGALRNLGTVSHEFFHQWNVERIRPRTLEPFNFEAANVSDALWFAEGFTSYYTGLMIRRAGLTDDSTYAASLSATVNTVVNAPGRRFFSPAEMSQRAPFVDAATSVDPRNLENTFISYYTWGSAIGLALDLTLRFRYDGRTLDGFMRAMWEQYGKPERPYVLDDLERALGAYTGDPAFASNFFARFIRGREVADYEALLGEAGFLLRKAHPGRAWLGVGLDARGGEAVVSSRALAGSPAYEAGLEAGDVILRLDDVEVTHPAHVETLIQVTPPGTALALTYRQRGQVREATLVLAEDPALEVVTYESTGRTLAPEARALRGGWLKSRR